MTEQRADLARITLSVLFIGGLIAGSLWILAPFLGAFVWATMIVVATWPLMRRVERVFGGRRAPAVAVMSLGLLAILIVPLGVALQACQELGMGSVSEHLPAEATQEQVESLVKRLNADPKINGILVQLPMPAHIDEESPFTHKYRKGCRWLFAN